MAWTRRWFIDSTEKWRRILDALRSFGIDFEQHPVEIIAREVVAPLSPPQRRLFHAACADLAPILGMTPGEVKVEVKRIYFGEQDNVDRLIDVIRGLPDDEWSTESLEHEHYGQLIETLYRFAAEQGIYLADRRRK